MKAKVSVYHFHNGSGGGVLTVIENLVRFSDPEKVDHHIIYTINKDNKGKEHTPAFDKLASRNIFYYSPRWNFHYTCKKLSRLIPAQNAVIVANDWLELAMVSHIGLANPVIQILHGDYDYYYDLAKKHQQSINFYVTVAAAMADKLRKVIPARSKDIFYGPFPVPDVKVKSFSNVDGPLEIIFVGRLSREKGYDLLPLLDTELRQKMVAVKWHIVGEVTSVEKLVWSDRAEIRFYGTLPNSEVIELMRKTDCLVLPSLAEGMPVTLVEGMKVGLTCLVNDVSGGIGELLTNGVTGYKIAGNKLLSYVGIIEQVNASRSSLKTIGLAASEKAAKEFDPVTNSAFYQSLFDKCTLSTTTARRPIRVYGSRLDRPWIPNFITAAIRGIFKMRRL